MWLCVCILMCVGEFVTFWREKNVILHFIISVELVIHRAAYLVFCIVLEPCATTLLFDYTVMDFQLILLADLVHVRRPLIGCISLDTPIGTE